MTSVLSSTFSKGCMYPLYSAAYMSPEFPGESLDTEKAVFPMQGLSTTIHALWSLVQRSNGWFRREKQDNIERLKREYCKREFEHGT